MFDKEQIEGFKKVLMSRSPGEYATAAMGVVVLVLIVLAIF